MSSNHCNVKKHVYAYNVLRCDNALNDILKNEYFTFYC